MAVIEKTIILKADTKGAVKGIDDVNKSLGKTEVSQKKLKDATKDTTKAQSASKKAAQRNAAGFEAVNKATGGAIRGVRGLIKQMWLLVANPIGAVIAALVLGVTALFKAFASTKGGGEKLAQMMAGVSATIDVLRDRVLKVGEALVKFFTGDFKGALEVGKEAVSGFGAEVAREFQQAADATRNLQEVADAARNLSVSRAELNKNLIKAKEIIEGSTASYDEKKKAIELVREAETKQSEDELKNAQKKLDAIVLANSLSDSGAEDLDKEAQARIQVINLEAESSRNKTKFNKLEKLAHTEEMARLKVISDEKKAADDLEAAKIKKSDDEKKKALEKSAADETKRLDNIQKIQDDFKLKQQDKDAETELQKINLEEERKLAELDRLDSSELQKKEVIDYYNGLRVDNKKATDKAETDSDNAKKEAFLGNLGAVSGALNGLSALAGENAEAQKGIGIAQAVIDTYVGATKALAQGGIAGPVAAAGVIASGLASVITIAKTKIPKPKGASGGGGTSASIPSAGSAPAPPNFNIVGASDTNQLADAVAGQEKQPVQAFVVANDVTTAQSLQNNIVEGSTI
tara:strand:- start:45 stop:1775 length:1731 start_codon:yes stop_codon:yes gene_type:complete